MNIYRPVLPDPDKLFLAIVSFGEITPMADSIEECVLSTLKAGRVILRQSHILVTRDWQSYINRAGSLDASSRGASFSAQFFKPCA